MHILIVSQYFWPEEFRINDLASELSARGHQITVLTGAPNYPMGKVFPAYARHPADFRKYNGVDIIRVPLVPRGSGALRLVANYFSFVAMACTLGVWKLRKIEFDVIFSPQLSPVTAMLPAILLRKLRRRKFAMWVLDLWPDTLQAIGIVKSPRILALLNGLVSFIYNRTDRLFVQSRSFVSRVRQFADSDIVLEYLPNWSEDMPELSTIVPAKEIILHPDTFNIMFAGAIGEAQDFPAILAAAEILRDEPRLRWLIVGDGRMSGWVMAEIKKRKLENFVMIGRHPSSRMPEFYRHADVMLVALKDEPIFAMTVPGKVQSYFAAGKPVIAMLNGEGAEVISAANAGACVSAGNGEALAREVRKMMLLDPDTLKGMGAAAKVYSDKNFNRRMLIDRIESELQELIDST